jgi:energy-coupling factor transporter ATP-binding protein EcfA2
MRYSKFIIKGYRGISDLVEIDIKKESLIPIIGKNESGKTTLLEAINSFDFNNDNENAGKHLTNIDNLYSTIETPLIVGAEIELDKDFDVDFLFSETFSIWNEYLLDVDFKTVDVQEIDENYREAVSFYQDLRFILSERGHTIKIERDLRTKKYSLVGFDIGNKEFLTDFTLKFVSKLPYILYFDDFRDRLDKEIYIIKEKENPLYSLWIRFINQLFIETNPAYSVFDLPIKQDSMRRSIIKEVEEKLNEVLIKEWSKYQFESKENLEIKIEYNPNLGNENPYLIFKIVEKIDVGNNVIKERFFDISDRSKGFFWYFNFMFKLHFNPSKRNSNDKDTVYLLDEPGSYLHSYAQTKLAEQLKNLSCNNKVIYCTHSHNLLTPEFIPLNSIRVAEKINNGKISIKKIGDKCLIRPTKNSAYQPVLDALEVRPPIFEYEANKIVLVEGIYDYYSFKMFCKTDVSFFPCANADSILQQIPFMIFLDKKYLAVWDNDEEGRSKLLKAQNIFGEAEGRKFFVLPKIIEKNKIRLEELFDNNEMSEYNKLYLKKEDTKFNKSILCLFHEKNTDALIAKYFPNTQANFTQVSIFFENKIKEIYGKLILESI